MISLRAQSLAWRALAISLGALFLYAGILKARDPLHFAEDIENYHLLPWSLGARFAFYLPWLEIICGLALIARRLYAGALAILSALMLVFLAATVIAKARGIDVSCGCFGKVSSNLTFGWHLVLDFAILAGFALLWWKSNPNPATPTIPRL